MDIVDEIRAFVATARTGSFTAGAAQLGISNRLTSKYVAELEARLGARLLQRTTRRVGLTPAGERLLARAPAWLDELDDLIGAVTEDARGYSGSLRISAPVTFGEVYVAGLLSRFAAPHADLTIDLRLTDAFADLAAEGIDLAFRIGQLPGSFLKARRLGVIPALVVASPAYIAAHGAPQRPADLAHHACILDTNRRDSQRWRFGRGADARDVIVQGRFMVNSARVVRDLALAGKGIAYSPDFLLRADVAAGRLVPLLTDLALPGADLSAVYLGGAVLPRKVRALIDFAVADAREHLTSGTP
ncbi:MAG: LysR family transcriptional regulator [Rhodobacteraceae bacterium]|nr:LysR family transcriptional regulator [Paracoccaceae bacterium]